MLCSIVRQSGASISSMLGSVGRFGSQLHSRPQPGTRVRVADRDAGDVARNLHAAPGHDHAVEDEPARSLAGDAEAVRIGGLPVEQAEHRPLAVGGAQLQRLVLGKLHRDRLGIDAAVEDLDHGIDRRVAAPFLQRVADPLELRRRAGKDRLLADAVDDGVGRLTDRTRIFAAAHVGAEAVGIGDPDGLLADLAGREHDPPELGVDGDLVADRAIAPAAQIGGDDPLRGDRVVERAGPDHQALLVAVVERDARHEPPLRFARLEIAAADRRGQAKVGRQARCGRGWASRTARYRCRAG